MLWTCAGYAPGLNLGRIAGHPSRCAMVFLSSCMCILRLYNSWHSTSYHWRNNLNTLHRLRIKLSGFPLFQVFVAIFQCWDCTLK